TIGGNTPTHCSVSSLTRGLVCQSDVLRTSSRGTPHETIQHRYHNSRRLTNRELRRTFSSTSATRIRLEDDENEDLEPPKNSRASKRPVRRPPPGPPKDLRTIILSREPKPRKPKYIDPEKVREIEAKVQMLLDPRQLVNEFLDSRYIHLEDQIATAHCTTQRIFCSHIEGLKSLVLCSEADCQRIELEYCNFVYRNTPQWTAAISDIERAVTRLRYKFITGRIEYSQLFIYRMRELLEREYLSPRQSARAKIDRLLQPTEDMREEYRSLQSLGLAVLTGLNAIKSLIIQLKVLDEQGPDLPGPVFQDFQMVLEAHKQDFAMAAHKHRADWFARVQNTTLVASQFWSAKKLTTNLLESMPERNPRKTLSLLFRGGLLQGDDEAVRESARVFLSFHRDQNLVANRLRKSYTKKWSGVKPANSPELNKVWRQLDVMALFETQQALDMSLQYEVWILMKSLEGKFGPMWPGLDSDASREIQKNLHEFSVKFNRSRKRFAAELEMYRLANWARLNVEEKLHKLGEPNDIQERGLFRVLKPLSQDHSRFNHWANHFVAVSFKNWNLNRLLKFSMEESEENVHNHYVRLAEDHLEQMSRPSSFVPEIGTTETRESRPQRNTKVKRPLFPMLKRMGLNEASIAPEAPSLPSKDAAKSTSSSPPQALTTTGPNASPRDSPPRPEQEHTVQHLKIRPLIEKSSKMPIENSAEIFDQNPRQTHNEQSARQHERQRDVKQSAKDLSDKRLPRPLKPPKAQQHKSRSMPRPKSSQELPVEAATAASKPAGPKEKNNTSPAASRSKPLVRSSSVWGFFARSGGSADVSRESISRAKSNRSVRQLPTKEVTPTSKAASSTEKNAVASTALKDKSRRLIKRPHLTKRQRQPALGPSRSPYRVRDVQRKLDLDFLSGQSAGIRPYSTRAYFSEAKANDSSVACIDEQSLPLGGPSPGESAVGREETVKDGGPPLFWTHSSQRGPGGQKLIVHYCRTLESTEEVARLFLGSKVIGFDMEWKAQASAWDSIQSNLSLIQVANEERIALFQIALFKPGQTLKDLVAPSLKQLLESPDITKVGVSIKADATRLRKYLGVEARSIFELSHLFKLVKYGLTQPKLVNKRGVNLSDQAEEHLGLPLEKSEDVRCGDWTRPLNYRQVQYAATDPYACMCLFNVMDQKRQAMDSVPPLPAHAELNLPIVLPPREKEPIASSPADDSGDIDVRS
ncbi:uncharacterized protein N7503_003962, partial [Penicillium pulvis]|uniref:uncharacterized protein n=1 Tax=Penicillium pulvis TaxID=1562058 RepID=UPI0025499755